MTSVTLHEGDNRDHLRRLIAEGVRVHSIVTDPPYGLVSVTKRFGAEAAAPAKFGTDGAFQRASAGFMGSAWDGTGIERDPEFWRLIWEILLPGGYVVAFSSTRTYHRMACAIEDAGFITHPMLGWVFGSGFPKAHNAAMAIDKALGVAGGRGEYKSDAHAAMPKVRAGGGGVAVSTRPYMADPEAMDAQARRYVPGSPEAAQWEGWAYGAQALKPALEPIYVGQKPFDGKTGAPSIVKWGVGALNIDGCRVPSEPGGRPLREVAPMREDVQYGGNALCGRVDGSLQSSKAIGSTDQGRHPANLLHDGSDDVVALFPANAKGGGAVSGKEPSRTGDDNTVCYGEYDRVPSPARNDTGSAARFFHAFPPDEPYPVFYHPKAGKADRAGSKHPTVKPIALMRWLCRLVTPPGGTVLDPFGGSGTTGAAALAEGFHSILMEAEPQFAADIRRRFDISHPHCDNHTDDYFGELIVDFDDLLGGAPAVDDFELLLG